MTSENKTWESLKSKYLHEVEKALSSIRHPRARDVLDNVRSHLDQRFAELAPDQQTPECLDSIITEMGPASDYAELLDPGAGHLQQGVRLKYVVGSAVAAVFVIVAGILLVVKISRPPEPVTTEEFRRGFLEKVNKFEIDTANLKDVVRFFGEPLEYMWGVRILDRKSLPRRYVLVYPDGFNVLMADNRVVELRHEGPGTGYVWRGKLRVGSSLGEVLEVVGRPTETVEGGPVEFRDGVLYKDFDGRKGGCYYGRSDLSLRLFFADYKVVALYVTRSGWVDGPGGGNLSKTVRQSDLAKSFPKIDRRPKPTNWQRGQLKSVPGYNRDSTNPFQVDLRGYDLSKLDLRGFLDNLLHSTFDERTIWPGSDRMSKGFDSRRLVEIGKNPGLGVRKLHDKGITGRDVAIAIIDNPLLVDHREYVERLRLYEEINVLEMKEAEGGHGADAHMHGTAVVSIAAGKTLGVAPQADVYYVATWPFDFGTKGAKGQARLNFKYRAQAVNRILEINKQLPKDKKIRVISMSIGWDPSQEGYKEITEAMEKAKAEGMLVICSSTEQIHGLKFHGLGRSPLGDPDDFNSYTPASWGQHLSQGKDRLLVPMDSRTTASPTGAEEYVFYRHGGWSWAIPYIAGVYALAAQVDPKIYPERFWALAMKTGRTIQMQNKGGNMALGPILDPVKLIGAIEAGDLSDNDAVTAELAKYKTVGESTPDNVEFRKDFNAKVAQLDIDNGKVEDIIRIFGEPQSYLWGKKTFTKDNLPDRYLMRYPNGFGVLVVRERIEELRHHGPGTGYLWRGKLRVGSSIEEVLEVVGRPTETVEGGPVGFKDGVLYRDIDGRKGHCYYARTHQRVRFFFADNKVAALYVTRSDFDAGGG
ncbi:MAG TPA: S8/S53 family peptidase [Sedimentisphaerales bacterium]|nr:S8/S53 family peptidase [Sedimentisphaerales bacterium]